MCIEKEYNWRSAGIGEPRRRREGGIFYRFSSRSLRNERHRHVNQQSSVVLSIVDIATITLPYRPQSCPSACPPPPPPPSHQCRGYSVSTPLCFSALHHCLSSLTSSPSSSTRVGPHQSCVAERVSAHINPSPPLTRCIGKGRRVVRERTTMSDVILLSLI